MKIRVPLTHHWYATLLSIYAQTLQASEEVLNSFECLCSTIPTMPAGDKLLILENFNACVGKDCQTWGTIRLFGIVKMNTSGLRLLKLCSELDLIICNTFFCQKIKHKATWFHLKSKHGHMIDIIIHKQDSSDVRVPCM